MSLMISHDPYSTNPNPLRAAISSDDEVTVDGGRRVVVFNIGGNKYRLIAAVHYNTQIVYVLLFLTHAQYDKDKWKRTL
jgi:mRNA interferase HigB